MKYAVKISPKRSIIWCDEKWYESDQFDNFNYTLEEALAMVQQLKEHFQYKITLLSEDGISRYFEFGKEITAQSVKQEIEKMIAPVETVPVVDAFDIALF